MSDKFKLIYYEIFFSLSLSFSFPLASLESQSFDCREIIGVHQLTTLTKKKRH